MKVNAANRNNLISFKSIYKIVLVCLIMLIFVVAFNTTSNAKEKYGEFYELNDSYITRILPQTTLRDFKNNIDNENVIVTNKDGREITDSEYIGSLMTARIDNNSYTLSVVADLDGNGIITITDLSKLRLYMSRIINLENGYQYSADINNDGISSITDLTQLNLISVRLKDIVAPESFIPNVTTTKDTITISGQTTDTSGSAVEYYFKIDQGSWIHNNNKTDGTYTYTSVDMQTSHTVKMKVKDSSGNEKATKKIQIGQNEESIVIRPSTISWTNEDINITVDYRTNIQNTKKLISIDGGTTFTEYTSSVNVGKNCTVVAQIRNNQNETLREERYTVTNIDKIAPKDFSITAYPGRRMIEVQVQTEDGDATNEYGQSGISKYKFLIKNAMWEWEEISNENTYTFKTLQPAKNYIIEVTVYDNAGNTKTVSKESGTDINYTLTIDANGGTYLGDQTITQEMGTIIRLSEPVKDGYVFDRWQLEGEGEVTNSSFKFGESDAKITAVWRTGEYTISYELNGGEISSPNPTTYNTETPNILLNNPTKNGYTFIGWTGSNGVVPEETVVIAQGSFGNKEYTANWRVNQYTVNFNANNGTVTPSYITADYGTQVQMPIPEKTYTITYVTNGGTYLEDQTVESTFVGWYKDQGLTQKIENLIIPANDTTLYAKWTNSQNSLRETTRNGFIFEGWYIDENLTQRFDENNNIVKDITLYAKWNANEYTINFNANGGIVSPTSITAKCDEQIIMPTPIKLNVVTYISNGGEEIDSEEVHSEFIGWYTDTNYTTRRTYQKMPAYDETLYARWQGSYITLPPIEREGYTFAGWYKDQELTQKANSQIFEVSKHTTLYAKWNVNKYTITYEYNGATGNDDVKTKKVEYASPYGILAEPEKIYTITYNSNGGTLAEQQIVNNTFLGWYKGNTQITSSTIVTSALDHKLYARWQENSVRLRETEKNGYIFDGWYESSTFAGEKKNAGDLYQPTSDIILHAKWNIEQYTITYNLNGGTVSSNPTSYTVESQTFTLENPTKQGYVFVGWLEAGETNTQYTKVITNGSTGNKEYTAVWTESTKTEYKVEHKQEQLDGTYVTVNTEYLKGTTGASITPAVKTYEGFTSPSAQTTTIAPDGSTTVTYLYERNKYQFTIITGTGTDTAGSTPGGTYSYGEPITLKLSANSGYDRATWISDNPTLTNLTGAQINITMPIGNLTMTSIAQTEVYYIDYDLDGGTAINQTSYTIENTPITINKPTKEGYIFDGWTGTDLTDLTKNVVIPQGSTGYRTYTANWSPATGIKYTVVHQQQNITATGYKTIEIEYLYGTTGTSVTPQPNNYIGFTAPIAQTVTIAGDGTTLVTYKYERNKYQFTLGTATGVNTVGSTPTGTYYYGATIELNAEVLVGYGNAKWTSSNTDKVQNITTATGSFEMPDTAITMTPSAIENTYTITYNLGGAGLPAGQTNPDTYKVSDTPIMLNNPEKAGYTFNGWTGSNGTTPQTVVTIPINSTGAKEYTANWTLKTYTISYNLNGGTVSSNPTTFTVETPTFTLENPTKEGYVFVGWIRTGETNPVYATTITQGSTGNRAYTAYWTESTKTNYTVEHKQQNADGTYTTVEVEYLQGRTGDIITPAVKLYAGFTSPSTQTTTIAADGTTLITYKYERNKYTFKIITGTGTYTAGSSASKTYYYGEPIKLKLTAKDGYIQPTWTSNNQTYNNLTGEEINITMPVGNLTMTSIAQAEKYIIDYNLAGGEAINPGSYTIEDTPIVLNNPSKEGYEFAGWTGTELSTRTIDVIIPEDSTGYRSYTANWIPASGIKYTVLHQQQNVTGSGYDTVEKEILSGTTGQLIQPAVKTTYIGFTAPSVQTATIAGDGSTTITYKYERNKYQFTLGAATGINTTGSTPSGTYYYGSIIELSADVATGYSNVKWTSSNTNKVQNITTAIGNFTMPDAAITMTPSAIEDTYTINYNLGGGCLATGQTNPDTYKVTTSTITLNNPVKAGYTFNGWTGSNGSTPQTTVTISQGSTGAKEYTANWTLNTYTIIYNLNDGIVSSNPQNYTAETPTFTLENPTKQGYVFVGWLEAGQTDPLYTTTIVQGSTGNRAYTAQWTENTKTNYTVEHKQQNIDGTYTLLEVEYLQGTTGDTITPNTKSYAGFTSPDVQTATIAADGTTVVEYKYNRNKYTFKIVTGTGTDTSGSSATKSYSYGEPIKLKLIAKEGYKNAMWISDNPSLTNLIGAELNITMPVGNVIMTSVAQVEIYTIEYDLNGGEAINPSSYTIEDTPIVLNYPTKEGYDFVGWTGSELSTRTKDVIIDEGETGDKSYVANWLPSSEIKYKVIHKQQNITGSGYDTVETENLTGTTGQIVMPAVKTYEGFTSPTKQTITISGDGTSSVTYLYERKKAQFTLGTGTGVTTTGSTPSGTYYYGTTIQLNAQVATGYSNAKWVSSALSKVASIQSATGSFTMPDVAITMTPSATKEEYNITYYLDGGTLQVGDSNPSKYTITDTPITLKNPVKTGYIFNGWTGSNGSLPQTAVTIPQGSTGPKEYTASWQTTEVTVNFETNGGNTLSNITVNYGSIYGSLPTPEKNLTITYIDGNNSTTNASATFKGWYKEQAFTNEVKQNTVVSTTNSHTLYAKWEDAKVTLITPTKDGYNFVGWYTDSGLTTPVTLTNGQYSVSQNITLYPKWEEQGIFVKLYSNGSLVFTNSNRTLSGYGTVVGDYGNIAGQTFASSYDVPWYNKVSSITKAEIIDEIKPVSTAYWFKDCLNLTSVDNISNLNTSDVTSMASMFDGCNRLTTLNVSGFDTSNVTNMKRMFFNCSQIGVLNVSNFNTSNVTDMSYMFYNCSNVSTLNVTNFNTSRVTDMSGMFSFCRNVTGLNVTNFDTSRVTNMEEMFYCCNNITSLNVGNFNTNNVTSMYRMFCYCNKLTSLNLNNFNTSNVTNMKEMFSDCSALTSLNVSSFNTSNVTTMESMFKNCSNLTNLDIKNFDISRVSASTANFEGIFGGTTNLTQIYGNKTWKVVNANYTTAFTGTCGTNYVKYDLTLTYEYNGATRNNTSPSTTVTYKDNYGTAIITPGKTLYIKYKYSNGTSDYDSTQSVAFTFNGWYTQNTSGTQVTSTTKVTNVDDHSIYARWADKSITLTEPTQSGYVFDGWYTDSSLTTPVTLTNGYFVVPGTATEDIKLYAKWIQANYSITTGTSVEYADTLQNALNATSMSGSIIKVLTNTTEIADVTVSNTTLTIDTNGQTMNMGTKTITVASGSNLSIKGSGTIALYQIKNNGELNINNATINGKSWSINNYGTAYLTNATVTSLSLSAIHSRDNGQVTIYSGNITGHEEAITLTESSSVIIGDKNEDVTNSAPIIIGESDNGIIAYNSSKVYYYNGAIKGTSTATVNSLTVPIRIENDATLIYRDGYYPVTTQSGSVYTATLTKANYSLTTGTTVTYHATLLSALNSAANTGSIITALNDSTESYGIPTVNSSSVTLNTNGKNITIGGNIIVESNTELTITGTGTISGSATSTGGFSTIHVYDGGTLNIENGTITNSTVEAITVHSGATLTMNGGKVYNSNGVGIEVAGTGNVTIAGGEVIGSNYGIRAGYADGFTGNVYIGSSTEALNKNLPYIENLYCRGGKLYFYNGAIKGTSTNNVGGYSVAYSYSGSTVFRSNCIPVTTQSGSEYTTTLQETIYVNVSKYISGGSSGSGTNADGSVFAYAANATTMNINMYIPELPANYTVKLVLSNFSGKSSDPGSSNEFELQAKVYKYRTVTLESFTRAQLISGTITRTYTYTTNASWEATMTGSMASGSNLFNGRMTIYIYDNNGNQVNAAISSVN